MLQAVLTLNSLSGDLDLPVEDADDAVLARNRDHVVVGGPGRLDLAKAADLWREAEDLTRRVTGETSEC